MRTFFLACLLLGIFSCATRQPMRTTAQLRWTGPLAADGCGFFLEFNGSAYKPINEELIPEELQVFEPQNVRITYEFTEEGGQYTCGMQGQSFPLKLKIIEIAIEND